MSFSTKQFFAGHTTQTRARTDTAAQRAIQTSSRRGCLGGARAFTRRRFESGRLIGARAAVRRSSQMAAIVQRQTAALMPARLAGTGKLRVALFGIPAIVLIFRYAL
ncbi:hypothetical protein EVAR_9627_1 [Eumeta japonica]|uniref:Uncharacterized protein n=1 Tax=Eumeta variegata TaxID=151549 RepID=A0A4C1TJR1_EUMVA|nr:hypothetical protein EVAR_9627_1 [Eumeta japonica]